MQAIYGFGGVNGSRITLLDSTADSNSATRDGGGAIALVSGSALQSTGIAVEIVGAQVQMRNLTARGNVAGGSGGGVAVEFDNRGSIVHVQDAVVSLDGVVAQRNVAGGSGGGMALSIPSDVQEAQPCFEVPTFLQSSHSVSVVVSNSNVSGNDANSSHSSGGGIFLGPGGALALLNTTCADNRAVQFGGGVALGTGVLAQGSCGFRSVDSGLQGNVAGHGGSQLYVACSAGEWTGSMLSSLFVHRGRMCSLCVSRRCVRDVLSTDHGGWLTSACTPCQRVGSCAGYAAGHSAQVCLLVPSGGRDFGRQPDLRTRREHAVPNRYQF
jgi:hypothetical protein